MLRLLLIHTICVNYSFTRHKSYLLFASLHSKFRFGSHSRSKELYTLSVVWLLQVEIQSRFTTPKKRSETWNRTVILKGKYKQINWFTQACQNVRYWETRSDHSRLMSDNLWYPEIQLFWDRLVRRTLKFLNLHKSVWSSMRPPNTLTCLVQVTNINPTANTEYENSMHKGDILRWLIVYIIIPSKWRILTKDIKLIFNLYYSNIKGIWINNYNQLI